jgi:hypothetical protein
MDIFVRRQLAVMNLMIKIIDKSFPEMRNKIIVDYLTELYVEQNVPRLWIEALSNKLKIVWEAPCDYSSESSCD